MGTHEHCDHDHDHPHPIEAKPSVLMAELRDHVPFSVSAVVLGLILAGILCLITVSMADLFAPGAVDHGDHTHDHADGQTPLHLMFFHLFHPAHMFFSGAATTAMFCRYDKSVAKAVVVGALGAIGVCGVSDIVMPQFSLWILGAEAPWHICILEEPGLVLPFAAVGVLVGLGAAAGVARSTLFSHSLHVFASTMASIFYMVGPLGMTEWIHDIGQVFFFVVLAVLIPCCLSDIVFPLWMSKEGRNRYEASGHAHHH